MKRTHRVFGPLLFFAFTCAAAGAEPIEPAGSAESTDSIFRFYELEAVRLRPSAKETQALGQLPTALSILGQRQVGNRGIESIKGLSGVVPNLYIPDYGSKMTTAVYLRGVGARSSGQSVGMYVDGIPYMDKSTFDFELMDVRRIEVLRGPQGTLYGRNAMGGIVNVHTWSPFERQGHRISIGVGNYNRWNVKLSKYTKLSERVAFSTTAYWDKQGGYFGNLTTNQKTDPGESAGGRLKLEWRIDPQWRALLAASYDYTDQGAYPYGRYDKATGRVRTVDFNDRGSYLRNMTNNSLRFEYTGERIRFSSNTGYQYLRDNMWMDQDFTPDSIFTLNQRQQQNSINQEFSIGSAAAGNYQWSAGAFGFYNHLYTRGNVAFGSDGIAQILQPVFSNTMPETVPVSLRVTDSQIPNPGRYKTPSVGAALFHQSTFDNLLTDGLSLTLGLRVDYERQRLEYNTSMALHLDAYGKAPMPPILMGSYEASKTLVGKESQTFWQWLPKVALTYDFGDEMLLYATVSKGYKAGGYNIQMFSEVIQDSLRTWRPAGMPAADTPAQPGDLKRVLAYKPEQTWNYELGLRKRDMFDGLLSFDVALFYMDVRNVQLTQFVDGGGSGRVLSNAGRGRTFGAEVSVTLSELFRGFDVDVSYGYTNATLRNYNDGRHDYRGNAIPYVPQHTFSVGTNYACSLGGLWTLGAALQYTGQGKIYWTEANDLAQRFYGLLHGKVAVGYDFVKLELWARNMLKENYGAFYFESFGNAFIQRGRPLTCGANVIFSF